MSNPTFDSVIILRQIPLQSQTKMNFSHFHSQIESSHFRPIKREDYHWLIDQSLDQQSHSKSHHYNWQLSTPTHSTNLDDSFNSSVFRQSKYKSPQLCSPQLPTSFSNNKPKRLLKQTYIEENQCSICLQIIKDKVQLTCSHAYCYNCLYQWLKNASKCPYCRSQITSYFFKGKKITVEPKSFVYQPRTEEILDWTCYRCNHTEQGDVIMICDRCQAYACHIECDQTLNGVQPEGQWYCHYCR